ncbi:MAG: hypothetical protein IKS51_02060 [Erysipelotrichaceae bacterium]|nr:hypothetical protein [Erysipelotrichaceae bacterium]
MFGRKLFDKKEKEITVADLQKIEKEYDRLLEVSFNTMGGMEDTHQKRYIRLENGVPVYVEEITADRSLPIRVNKYSVADETIMDRMSEYIREYNLPAWEDLPFDEEMIALDASSSYVYLLYDNSAIGGYKQTSFTISYDDKIPKEGYPILQKLRDDVTSNKDESRLIETYLLTDTDDESSRIYTGKEIDNTEEEIQELLRGFWDNKENGTYLNMYYFEDGLSYMGEDYSLKKIVHENLNDLDSSWYAIYETEEKEIKLTVVKDRLIIVNEDQIDEMIRY